MSKHFPSERPKRQKQVLRISSACFRLERRYVTRHLGRIGKAVKFRRGRAAVMDIFGRD